MMKHKISKLLSIVLAVAIVCSLMAPALALEGTDTIRITNAEDLMRMAQNCSLDTWSKGKTVSLEADITLEGYDFRPIPSFGGTFLGNGHTISGLELTDSSYPSGLFGVLQSSAVVQGLNVTGAVTPTGDKSHVGGIVGENHGTIQSCTFTGTVIGNTYTGGIVGHNTLTGTVKDCRATGEVIGKNMTGGIVGYNEGAVSQCVNGSLVNTISLDPSVSLSELNTLFTADLGLLPTFDTINIASDTGGIAGYSTGMILGCENNAVVGYAHVGYNVGGIVGRNSGHLANCQNSGAVYGRKEVGGIAGQMEPHISLNLSVDYVSQLKDELDTLQQMVNGAANRADAESAAISSRLDTIGGLIDSASGTAKELSDQVVNLGKDTVTEVNRGSDILDETISQLSGIADQFPALSGNITVGLDQLEAAVLEMADVSKMGTAAIADMKLAAEDASSAIAQSRTAADKISDGLDKLSSALTIKDKAAVKEALSDIADGLSELVDAVGSMSDAVDALIAILQNAGWTDDGVKHLKNLSSELQNVGEYLSDIHGAVTIIKENVDLDWEKVSEGGNQLLEALGYFSTASQKLDEAMVLAESGIGKINAGIEQLMGAVQIKDSAAVDAALAQITTGFQELSQSASDASAAMAELANALSSLEGLEDLPPQMDNITAAIIKISQAGQSASAALGEIAEALSIISENIEIAPGDVENGAALTLKGFNDLLSSIAKLREANTALSNGFTLLRQGLSNLSTAVEIKDEAAIRAALSEIHTAIGNIASAIETIGVIMEEMAGTLEEMQIWGDSLVAVAGQIAAAFSDFSDALTRIRGGVDTLRNNVTLDPDSATEGLSEIRDGMKMMVSASVALENSIGHFYDSLTNMETASQELTDALELLADALDTFEGVSADMTNILGDAKALFDYLDGVDPIQFPVPGEDISETANELYSYINDVENQMGSLNQEVSSASDSLTADIRAINDQFSRISDTLVNAIYHTENAANGDVIHDISEEALSTITAGKAFFCKNEGYVEGDINIGGIVGSIAIENQLDPEDDLASSFSLYQYQSYELSAVVQSCINHGTVVAKKDHVGGICGKMDLGLLIGCESYGLVESETGDYVGGIAGSSSALIRSCFAKCTLTGGSFVGGILGCGADESSTENASVVSDCYALVDIVKHSQHAGAIAGFYAGSFSQNFFVSDFLAGINRLSYSGQAEPITYAELLELSKVPLGNAELTITFPREFMELTLRFVADGNVLKTLSFQYGASFDEGVYPELPPKEGYYARWDKEKLENLHYDTIVTAVYTPNVTAVESVETRDGNRPLFFVEGKFDDATALSVQSVATTPAEFNVFPQSFRDVLIGCFTGSALSREVIEQWQVVIPQDGEEVHTLRYLAPDGDPDNLQIYIKQDNGWRAVETWTVGSYLCFAVAGEQADIAVISTMPTWWVRVIAAVLGLLVIIVLLRLIYRFVRGIRKRRTIRRERKAALVNSEHSSSRGNPGGGSTAVATHVKKKKKNKVITILIILLLLGGILGAAYVFLLPELSENYKAYTLVKELTERPQLSMELTATAEMDGKALSADAFIDRQQVNGCTVTSIESGAVKLYYADGAVFLENGNAYQVSKTHPDQSQVLDQLITLLRYVDVNAEDGVFTIAAEGNNAAALLDALIPSAAGEFGNSQTLAVELISANDEVSAIRFLGNGSLANPQNTEYSLSAVLTVLPEKVPSEIPAVVLSSIETGASENIAVLTEEILRLANAWLELNEREQITTTVGLTADCGPLTVNDQLSLSFVAEGNRRIGILEKGIVKLYFSGDTVCTEQGLSVSSDQSSPVETARLFEVVYNLCMVSETSCTQSGAGYVYSLQLDEEGMRTVAEIIAPETAGMDIDFESGSVELLITDEKIQNLTISCAGNVKLLVSSANAKITANIQIHENAEKIIIPQTVINSLSESNNTNRQM